TVSGSILLTNLSSTTNLVVGMPVTGTGIPNNTTISSIINNTSIALSNAATATGTGVTFTFTSGITTAASNVVIVSSTTGLVAGMQVTGPGIAPNTTITAVAAPTVTLS